MSDAGNRVALITGAARRVGAGLARALAEAGWDVAVHHRGGADDAAVLVDELTARGVRAAAFQADLNEAAWHDTPLRRIRPGETPHSRMRGARPMARVRVSPARPTLPAV